MALSDRLGLAVSTSSSEALTAYEQGLDLALRWRSGAMDALTTAQVCRQLIRRAEEVQAAPDIPALQEARQVLQADV